MLLEIFSPVNIIDSIALPYSYVIAHGPTDIFPFYTGRAK